MIFLYFEEGFIFIKLENEFILEICFNKFKRIVELIDGGKFFSLISLV